MPEALKKNGIKVRAVFHWYFVRDLLHILTCLHHL